MFHWLSKICRSSSRKYAVGSDDYQYGFKRIRAMDQSSDISSTQSIRNSTEHIYEDIDENVIPSQKVDLAYAITSLVEIMDCEICDQHVNAIYFPTSMQTGQLCDSAFESRHSDEETDSTTSSFYQPIRSLPTNSHVYEKNQRTTTRPKLSLAKIKRSKDKCSRWLLAHFVPSNRSGKQNILTVTVDSSHIDTKRFRLISEIKENWFDFDDDSSDDSDDSAPCELDLLNFSALLTDADVVDNNDVESDSGRSSLYQSELLNQPADQISASTSSSNAKLIDHCDPDSDSGRSSFYRSQSPIESGGNECGVIVDLELPYFNPRFGFGLNRWYKPSPQYR